MEAAERYLAENVVETVRVEWCDLHGASRGKQLSPAHFLAAVQSGTTFSSAALLMDLQGDAHVPPDRPETLTWANLVAMPDVSTLQPHFLQSRSARCLADLFSTAGQPIHHSPRYALKSVVEEGWQMGLQVSAGIELEFYLLRGEAGDRPTGDGVGRQVYRMQNSGEEHQFLDALRCQMSAAGIGVEAFCAEDGPGQFEVILDRAPPIVLADAAFTARNLIKEQATRQGLTATFLSRPLAGFSGSGAHVHQSLWTPEGNAIPSGPDEDPRFWQYLAGQLKYFEAASAFYLPTINAYKRIALRQPNPLCIDWAHEDRSAAIRVIGMSGGAPRLENRAVAGEANPYLCLAACLASGFEGIRSAESIPVLSQRVHGPGESLESCGAPLPRSLSAALDLLSACAPLRRWLSDSLVDSFILLKRSEVRRFETAITDWELREYLQAL